MTRSKQIAIAVVTTVAGSVLLSAPIWLSGEGAPTHEASTTYTYTAPEYPQEALSREPSLPVPTLTEEVSTEEASPVEDLTPESPTPSVENLPTEEEIEPEPIIEPEPENPPDNNPASAGLTISGYVNCTGDPQPCIDAGSLTYYSGNWSNGEWSQLIAGHDYMGFEFLNSVPVGTIVEVQGGAAAGTYEVYDHMYIGRQGGDMPRFNGASLVLQSCKNSGTGFSLLRAV